MHGPLCSVTWKVFFPKHPGLKGRMACCPKVPLSGVLPACSGVALYILHLRWIFLAVTHPCTWGFCYYLCSEFPNHSKILRWEPLPHPQALARASRGPFCSMTRFLESASRSASFPGACLGRTAVAPGCCGLSQVLNLSATCFLTAPVCPPSLLGGADVPLLV